MNFQLRRCQPQDYEEFLAVANEAFGHSQESAWFQQNVGHCVPYPALATAADFRHHILAFQDGRVVGGVGAYPMELVVRENNGERFTLKTVGIGQVCCAPEARGQGVMTAALTRALAEAAAKGAVLAVLGGDRFRYGHFGFDFFGSRLRLTYQLKRLEVHMAGLDAQPAGPKNIMTLAALHGRMDAYVHRDTACWEKQLGRHNLSWTLGRLKGQAAYLAHGAQPEEVLELVGDPAAALALLRWHMETRGLEALSVVMPLRPLPVGDPLWQAASGWTVGPTGLAAVLRRDDLLIQLEPYLERQHVRLVTLSPEQRARLPRRILASPVQPLAEFSEVRPVICWLPPVDDI
jgi:predicted N-acetyltransferase YhbS